MAPSSHKVPMFLFTLLVFSAMQLRGLTMEQRFVFDSSGGMKVAYKYEVPNRWVGVLAAFQKEAAGQINLAAVGGALDEDAVRRQFSGLRGVYLEHFSPFQLDDALRVEFTVVALDAAQALESGVFGPIHYRGPTAEDRGGFFELQMPDEELSRRVDAAHVERLAEMLGGFDCTLEVTAPSPVLEEASTGTAASATRRVWHLSLTEILARQFPKVRVSW